MLFDKTFQRVAHRNLLLTLTGKKCRIAYQNPHFVRFARIARIKRFNGGRFGGKRGETEKKN